MRTIPQEELTQLIKSCKCLYGSLEKPSIMLDSNGNILKFFYPTGRWFSIKNILPAAGNFTANARKLKARGIATVSINNTLYCKNPKRYIVSYPQLPGEDFRELYASQGASALAPLPAFIAHLHNRGIFFRAIHLGNLLLQPDDDIALLDFQDSHFSFFKLGPFRRARNLSHLLNTKMDLNAFLSYGVEKFIDDYLRHANLSALELKLFILQFNSHSSNHKISSRPEKR